MPFSSFHKRLTIGFAAVVLCAALIAASSLVALRSIREHNHTVLSVYGRELTLAQNLQYAIERKVSAARALLLSKGDETYQERINSAQAEATQVIAELRRTALAPDAKDLIDRIERAEREHQADLEEDVRLLRSGATLEQIQQHWRTNTAVHRDELRGAVDAFVQRREALLEEAQDRAVAASSRLTTLIIGMTAVGLLLALTLALLMSRTLVRMYNDEGAARTAAEDARQWFATTLASIGDAVIATDKHGKITFINEIACRLTSWHAADALGRSIQEVFVVIQEKTRVPVDNPVERVLQTGMPENLANHTVLVGRDGQERPIDDSAAPIRDNRRGLIGVVLVFRDVSARRRAETKIRETSEWLSTTLRSIGDAVIATSADGRVTMMNPVAQHLTGWTEAEAVGAPLDAVFRIVNEQTRKPVENPVQKVLRTGSIIGLANHTVLVARDGTEWPLDDSGAPIRDSEGNIIGVVLVFREVTERRRAEEALQASEARFRSVYERAGVGIEQVAPNGRLLMVNAAQSAMLGYTPEEMLQKSFEEITHPEDRENEARLLSTLLAGKTDSYEVDKRYLHRDGSPVWVHVTSSAVRDQQGRLAYRISVIQNVTERRLAEDALRVSEERYRGLYDSLREGIIYVGPDDHIQDCNPALLDLLGYSKEEIVKLTYQQITPPKWHRTDSDKVSTQVLTRGYSEEWEKEFLRRDGTTVPVVTRSFAMYDQQGRVVGRWSVVRDISEQQRAQEALVRSEKLASVGRLAATIAHEINNPLEAITNALFLVASDPNLAAETRSYVETAEQELQRVAHLTKQTLGFYREASAPIDLAVQQVAENVLALYERKLRNKRIRVFTRYRTADQHLVGNAGEIRQVMSNLVANAIDALPQNGALHLRVACCRLWRNGGTALRLTVADTGSGIQMPHLGSIFEPFFTTKEAVGTGLGLWVTREIVRKYGGRIQVRTRAGQGTVFCIYLPATPAGLMAAKAS